VSGDLVRKMIVTDDSTLPRRVAALGRPLVFTNGAFDILHRGRVAYRASARALVTALVLGLNSNCNSSARLLGKAPIGRSMPTSTAPSC